MSNSIDPRQPAPLTTVPSLGPSEFGGLALPVFPSSAPGYLPIVNGARDAATPEPFLQGSGGILHSFPQRVASGASRQLQIPEAFEKFRSLFLAGVNTQEDFNLALEFFEQISPELKVVVDIYRKNPVLVRFGTAEGSSACFRKGTNAILRKTTYADEIFLEKDANLFWVIHEIMHAIPLGTEEKLSDDSNQDELVMRGSLKFKSLFPAGHPFHHMGQLFPKEGNLSKEATKMSLRTLFIDFVGRHVRDEGLSGLAEVLLLDSLKKGGFEVPLYSDHVQKGSMIVAARGYPEPMKAGFLDSDIYLGDNHFLLYNLRGLFLVAKKIKEDPTQLDGLALSDRLDFHGVVTGGNHFDPSALEKIDLMELFSLIKEIIEKPLSPGETLLPMQIRLRRYLSHSRLARTLFDLTAQPVPAEINLEGFYAEFPPRPLASPPGDSHRIKLQSIQTRDRVVLAGTFVDYLERLYSFSNEEIRLNMEAYLRYAERCPPEFAAQIYARLQKMMFSLRIDPREALLFAHSCLLSGYIDIAEKLLIRALYKATTSAELTAEDLARISWQQVVAIGDWDSRWNEVLVNLVELGRTDVARLITLGVQKGHDNRVREYRQSVLWAISLYGKFMESGMKTLRDALKLYQDEVVPTGVILAVIDRLEKQGQFSWQISGMNLDTYLDPRGYLIADGENLVEEDLRYNLLQLNKRYEEKLSTAFSLRSELLSKLGGIKERDQLGWFHLQGQRWYKQAEAEKMGREAFFRSFLGKVAPDELIIKLHDIRGHLNQPRIYVYDEKGNETLFGEVPDYEAALLAKSGNMLKALAHNPQRARWLITKIEALPDTVTKLNVIESLWEQNGKTLPAPLRARLFALWEAVIEACAGELADWNYAEAPSLRYLRKFPDGLPSSPQESHFYHQRTIRLAQALFATKDDTVRMKGKTLLEGILFGLELTQEYYIDIPFRGQLTRETKPIIYREYASVHGRVFALLLLAEEFPDEAERYLEEATTLLREHPAGANYELALLVGEEAYLMGLVAEHWATRGTMDVAHSLVEEAISRLSGASLQLKRLPTLPPIPPDAQSVDALLLWHDRSDFQPKKKYFFSNSNRERLRDKNPEAEHTKLEETKRDLLLLLPVRTLSRKKGGLSGAELAMLDPILDRLRHDVNERNWFYPLSTLILVAEQLCLSDALRVRGVGIFSLAIHALALGRGSREFFERDGQTLIQAIWDAPLAHDVRDALYADITQKLFPDDRRDLWGQSFDLSFLTGRGKEPGLFHRIFETEHFPKSEEVLLQKFMGIRKDLAFDRSLAVKDRARLLHIWTEIFVHVVQKGEILNPDNYEAILALAPDDDQLRLMVQLIHPAKALEARKGGTASHPHVADILQGNYDVDQVYLKLKSDLQAAMVESAPLADLEKLLPLLQALHQRELRTAGNVSTHEEIKQLLIISQLVSYLGPVLEEKKIPTQKQEKLFNVLLDSSDREIAHVLQPLFELLLADASLPLSVWRSCFEGLVVAGKYSPYLNAHHRRRLAQGDEALRFFYRHIIEWEKHIGRMDDYSLSLLVEKKAEDAGALLDKYREAIGAKGGGRKVFTGVSGGKPALRFNPADLAMAEYQFYREHLPAVDKSKSKPGKVKIDVRIDDHDGEWFAFLANLIRAVAIQSYKDKRNFRSALSERAPFIKGEFREELVSLFDRPYTAAPEQEIRELVLSYVEERAAEIGGSDGGNLIEGDRAIDGYEDEDSDDSTPSLWRDEDDNDFASRYDEEDDEVDEDEDGYEDEDGVRNGSTSKRWSDEDDEDFVDSDEHKEAEPVSANPVVESLTNDLVEIFDTYSLWTLRGDINRVVFKLLPGTSLLETQPQQWNLGTDEFGQPVDAYLDGNTVAWHLLVHSPGSSDKAGERLKRLEDILPGKQRQLSYRRDRVRMTQVEMPEIFRKRPPLVQFLLMRYFLELPVGEQKDLITQLEPLGDKLAIREFFRLTGLQKVGQFLSIWPEVPPEHREELAGFQDRVAPSDIQDVKDTIMEQLPPEKARELIRMLDPSPLSAGTIGEVYLLKKEENIVGVLKIIPRTKRQKIETMLRRFHHIRNLLSIYRSRVPSATTAIRVVTQLIETVEKELDLRLERKGAGDFRTALQALGVKVTSRVRVPDYDDQYEAQSVLVMNFENGTKITELKDRLLAGQAGEFLDGLLNQMIMESDVYPDDLHPGNILIDEVGGKIVLLDFGRLGRTSVTHRKLIARFVMEAVRRSASGIVECMEQMSVDKDSRYKGEALLAVISQKIGEISVAKPFDLLSELLTAAGDHGLAIDTAYIQVLKAKMTLLGTLHEIRKPSNGGSSRVQHDGPIETVDRLDTPTDLAPEDQPDSLRSTPQPKQPGEEASAVRLPAPGDSDKTKPITRTLTRPTPMMIQTTQALAIRENQTTSPIKLPSLMLRRGQEGLRKFHNAPRPSRNLRGGESPLGRLRSPRPASRFLRQARPLRPL